MRAVLCAVRRALRTILCAKTPVFALRNSHCEPRFRTAPAQCDGGPRTAQSGKSHCSAVSAKIARSSARAPVAVRGGSAFRWDGVLRWVGVWDLPNSNLELDDR